MSERRDIRADMTGILWDDAAPNNPGGLYGYAHIGGREFKVIARLDARPGRRCWVFRLMPDDGRRPQKEYKQGSASARASRGPA